MKSSAIGIEWISRHSKSVKISTSALFAPKKQHKKRVNPSAIKFATKHCKRLFFAKKTTSVLIFGKKHSSANLLVSQTMETFLFDIFCMQMQNQNKWSFWEKQSFTVFCREFYSRRVYAFFVLFFWAKSAFVLIFTLLECLKQNYNRYFQSSTN